MKIALDISSFSWEKYTGIQRYMENIMLQLAHVDSEYEVQYFQKWSNKTKIRLPEEIPQQVKNYFWEIWPWEKFELAHGLDGRIPNIRSKAKITTFHDLMVFHDSEIRIASDNFIKRKKKQFNFAAKNSDALIAVSEYTRKDVSERLNVPLNKIFVTPLGIESRFIPASEEAIKNVRKKYELPEEFLLFVGSISARKNTVRILQAHASIVQKSGIPLVLAGTISYDGQTTLDTIKKLDISKSVFLPGYIDDQDLPILYSAASGFVFPTLMEGFGFPILESMACGTPVLVSNFGAAPETGGSFAIECNPLEIESIAEGMKILLNSKSILPDEAINYAQSFTWEKCISETLKIYEKFS